MCSSSGIRTERVKSLLKNINERLEHFFINPHTIIALISSNNNSYIFLQLVNCLWFRYLLLFYWEKEIWLCFFWLLLWLYYKCVLCHSYISRTTFCSLTYLRCSWLFQRDFYNIHISFQKHTSISLKTVHKIFAFFLIFEYLWLFMDFGKIWF